MVAAPAGTTWRRTVAGAQSDVAIAVSTRGRTWRLAAGNVTRVMPWTSPARLTPCSRHWTP